jgi:asparagine synthase (glutamine-hydrolysing)
VITDRVYRRQKHPFLSPPDVAETPSRMAALIQDVLRSKVVDSVPFLNGPVIRSLADALPAMSAKDRGAIDPGLMMLMSYVFMHQRLVQKRAA